MKLNWQPHVVTFVVSLLMESVVKTLVADVLQ